MTSIQVINSTPSFTSKNKVNENYYTGLKTGAVYAGVSAAAAIGVMKSLDPLIKSAVKLTRKNVADGVTDIADACKTLEPLFKARKALKNYKYMKSIVAAAAVMTGIGGLVDIMNNQQRKANTPNAKSTSGKEYTNVDMGKRTGAFLGAVYSVGSLLFHAKTLKAMGHTPVQKFFHICIAAVGGYVLGAIADKMANNKAARA